jgi:DNA-directed RNA polymerase I and III subunit RPAC1
VYSGDLKWMPHGDQLQFFPDGVDVVEDKILLLKLRPGQQVKAELLCVKGWGGDHAKFSPVGK